jgi:DNA-binding SARP family transcriptional activator/tetratricopeptide (TPR) repeat protein
VKDGAEPVPGALATLLRTRRGAAGLTQRQLAARAGISLGALQDLEQGRVTRPRGQSLSRLAAALQLGTAELAGLTASPPGTVRPARASSSDRRDPAQPGAAAVRVEILGPLVVWRDGQRTDLGSFRLRVVLGLLALHAGTGLRLGAIKDALWGQDPPATSAMMVQGQVSRIRHLLGPGPAPGGGPWLWWDTDRYRLAPGGIGIDAVEFGELIGKARGSVAAGDPAAACPWYERALGMWRGQPLEDIETLRGHPAVTTLSRRHGDVVLEYAAAAADAGLQDRVVTHLEALTAREPLDERAHAQLMLTLAATGRQAAALGIYQDLAGRLAAELGVSPGPELSAAYQQVLRQQVPTVAAARKRPGPGRVVPRQLPAAAVHFVGRAAEMAVLTETLDQAAATERAVVISAIGGTAGVGKTALAVHWAHQAASRFPDGQLYVNLRGFGPAGSPVTAEEAVRLFLDGLGVPPDRIPISVDAQAALYRSLLAGQRMLLVLDNARDPQQVRPLLPGAPGCLVLITSRNQLTGLGAADGARLISLPVLSEAEARELLTRRLGAARVAAEPAAVTELTGLCARLPLALGIAAAHAAARPGLPLAVLAAELRDARGRLDALGTGDVATDMRTVFSWSCEQLSPAAARVFRLLGVHPGPDVTMAATASLAGLPVAQTRQVLDELTRSHMITEHAPGRYAFHDLLRSYAAEQARVVDDDGARRGALLRLLDHYLHTACVASLLIHPYRDQITLVPPRPLTRPEQLTSRSQALAWFQAERQVMLAVSTLAADAGFGPYAWQLPWAVAMFLDWHGYWPDLMATQESALAAAARAGDVAGQAEAHRYLGHAKARLGAHADAMTHLAQGLELSLQLDNQVTAARAYFDLGHICMLQGRTRDALGHVEEAMRRYRAAGHRSGQGNALNALCWLKTEAGQGEEALECGAQALAIHRELGDRTMEAAALDTLGYAQQQMGNHGEAIACYQQAISAYGKLSDRYNRAEVLIHLGDACQSAGDQDAARRAWRRALTILDDMQHPDADGVRSRLGSNGGSAGITAASNGKGR